MAHFDGLPSNLIYQNNMQSLLGMDCSVVPIIDYLVRTKLLEKLRLSVSFTLYPFLYLFLYLSFYLVELVNCRPGWLAFLYLYLHF